MPVTLCMLLETTSIRNALVISAAPSAFGKEKQAVEAEILRSIDIVGSSGRLLGGVMFQRWRIVWGKLSTLHR